MELQPTVACETQRYHTDMPMLYTPQSLTTPASLGLDVNKRIDTTMLQNHYAKSLCMSEAAMRQTCLLLQPTVACETYTT